MIENYPPCYLSSSSSSNEKMSILTFFQNFKIFNNSLPFSWSLLSLFLLSLTPFYDKWRKSITDLMKKRILINNNANYYLSLLKSYYLKHCYDYCYDFKCKLFVSPLSLTKNNNNPVNFIGNESQRRNDYRQLLLIFLKRYFKNQDSIMGNGMNKVLPGLYVGNYRDSKDASQLDRFEITHILAIHDAARRIHADKHYLCIMASDTPDQNLSQYFPVCNDFIHSARLRGGNVLIHCLAGMSRSVTVAVAYIMSTTDLTWKDALKVVRVGRAVANPNVGFQQQLEDFEMNRLQEERRRLKERFPSLALASTDSESCRATLLNYESLALAREVCEGKCAMGRTCPTGMCRQASKRNLRRKASNSSQSSLNSTSSSNKGSTQRLLPSAPPSPAMPRSTSVMSSSSSYRPRSGPAGLHYYTGSAPSTRVNSRVDLSSSTTCSSRDGGGSNLSLSTIGRSTPVTSTGNVWRYTSGSAPVTPRATPPASPQHWPRRMPMRPQVSQLAAGMNSTPAEQSIT